MSQSIVEAVEESRQVNQAHSEVSDQLRYKTARAAMTSGGGEVVTRVLTIVLAIVTARTLEPVEVGLLGLSVIVIGVVSMLGYYPETAAVTARREGTDQQYAIAATGVRIGITVFFLTMLWLTFPVVARYLTGKDDGAIGLAQLLGVLAWMPVLELLSGYPQVVMQRRLDLNFIAWLQILQPILFVGPAIVLLVAGHGYMGVAWANIASSAAIALLLWLRLVSTGLAKWGGWPSKTVWRETVNCTGKVLVGGFGGYLGARIDNVLVAGSIGPTAMSFYSMAWNASRTPVNVFAKAINFALVPTLARIQDDPFRVQRALRECLSHAYLLLTPICALLFVSAPLLVSTVLGQKWLPLVPCLRVMCITALAGPILIAANALLLGTGRGHLPGISSGLHILVLAMIIPPLASQWGVLGAGYGDLAAVTILTVALCITARVATGQINRALLSTILLPVIGALSAGLIAWAVGSYIGNEVARLIGESAIVLAGYPLFVFAYGGKARLFDLAGLLQGLLRRLVVAV